MKHIQIVHQFEYTVTNLSIFFLTTLNFRYILNSVIIKKSIKMQVKIIMFLLQQA